MKLSRLIIPIVVYLLLLAGAVVWDCHRIAASLADDVRKADAALLALEKRYIANLPADVRDQPQVKDLLSKHEAVQGPSDRQGIFESLVSETRAVMTALIDVSDPLARAAADELAGSLNRRAIAKRDYDAAMQAYAMYAQSLRGRLGGASIAHFKTGPPGASPRSSPAAP